MRCAAIITILLTCTLAAMASDTPPSFPLVRGEYQMTENWHVTLPEEFAKRFEKGEFGTDLVLWRPSITCWITVYGQKKDETPEATYAWRKARVSKDAVEVFEFRDTKPLRLAYLTRETPKDAPERWALQTFTFGTSGHVLMAIYFDRREDLEIAKRIWRSTSETRK